jgi:light-harvesting complex I chlorophyll a/b binding protein 4
LGDLSDDALGARLLDSYFPGDIGFDPLGWKPKTDEAFNEMATKEINNGRLAMFGAIGMLVQEQVTHEPIFETLNSLF